MRKAVVLLDDETFIAKLRARVARVSKQASREIQFESRAIENLDRLRRSFHEPRDAAPPTVMSRPTAKIDFKKAALIRLDTRKYAEIASDYGVSEKAISNVNRGYSWKPEKQEPAEVRCAPP